MLLLLHLSLFGFVYGNIVFVIIDQPILYHKNNADNLVKSIDSQSKDLDLEVKIFRSSTEFNHIIGAWTFWPIANELLERINVDQFKWIFTCEDETSVNVALLNQFLHNYNANENIFLGYALHDRHPTIIHHYAFVNNPTKFAYPDFARGFVLSTAILLKLKQIIQSPDFKFNFAIDAKHELAMLLWNNGRGSTLLHNDSFCTENSSECITSHQTNRESCRYEMSIRKNFKVAVKTYQKFHRTRIPVVKNTWAKEYNETVEYFSDSNDPDIPTVKVKVRNTNRGHCGKTFIIMSRFVENFENNENKWLIIVDDDTLISLERLKKLVKCFDIEDKIIIGERYGFGFSAVGDRGYDYPTGGSGMVFSPTAVKLLTEKCNCPSLDSPDDMIIGMCARNLGIPIIHNAAFHQARPEDYSSDYISRLKPISFHKHYEIDPYDVYRKYLLDNTTENAKNHDEF